MENFYLGVDPGKSGAIAILREDGTVYATQKLDATERDIAVWLQDELWDRRRFAYIERVSAMPKQGVSSTFKFGQSYGFLRGLLVALSIPFEEVTPGVWQRSMGCLSKGDKNVTKSKAQQLFPGEKVCHWNADALLLAEFCRRVSERSDP